MALATVFGAGALGARRASMSSTLSDAGSLVAQARKATVSAKSDVHVHIDHHYKSKTYTCGSRLEGEVTITTQKDVAFDRIEIILIGSSRTRTEGYSTPHASIHTFLKLPMPINEDLYPSSRMLMTGRSLTLPFNFVIPDFLTLSACNHKVDSDRIRDHHLCLPPSMGWWARESWEKDDLGPHMAEVEYSIKARVFARPDAHGRRSKLMEGAKAIQILPTFPEDAPLSINSRDAAYRMTKSKTLRKSLISAKLGKLTVSGQQPRAIMLHPDGHIANDSMAQLDLRFEPATGDARPPKITAVSAKIAAHTYYSASAISELPNVGDWMRGGMTDRRGVYSTSVALRTPASHITPWSTHRVRRDSGYGSETSPASSASCSSDEYDDMETGRQGNTQRRHSSGALANLIHPKPSLNSRSATTTSKTAATMHHTATVQVPIDLPTEKRIFVPSFHSCIVSRMYTLHVTVRVDAGTATTLSLDLPLQIGVEGTGLPSEIPEALPSWEEALEAAEADEYLRPRLTRVLRDEVRATSELPRYARLT